MTELKTSEADGIAKRGIECKADGSWNGLRDRNSIAPDAIAFWFAVGLVIVGLALLLGLS